MRATFRSFAQRSLDSTVCEVEPAALARSALIFAPHPDDETLACGGTIIKKLRAGARVGIVFLTDGSHSHSVFLPPEQLAALREREALAAASAMGVGEGDITFLRFEDGRLSEHQEAAVTQVAALLGRFEPQEVYIPYAYEPPSDHVATNRIVRNALTQVGLPARVYEYPVWFWRHWPWMGFPGGGRRQNLRYLRDSLLCGFGWQLIHDFRHFVDVGSVLEQKRMALEEHQTQMRRYQPDTGWPVLADVSNGELLSLCLSPREYFALSEPI